MAGGGTTLLKAFLRNSLLLLISALVALVLGEITIRLAAPQQLIVPNDQIWRPDPEIGWRHVENANAQINTGEQLVHFVTDADGYRINYPASPPTTDSRGSIIVIGDSFIEATALENEDALPHVLQELLFEHAGLRIEVVNDGVGAWGPNQYLKEVQIALAKRHFDLGIVCLFTGNDIESKRQTQFSPKEVSAPHFLRWPTTLHRRELVNAVLYPINDWLEMRSHLFVFLRNQLQAWLARVGLSTMWFPVTFERRLADSECWSLTRDICRDMSAAFAAKGATVLFVLLPASFQVYEDDFQSYLNTFNISADSVDIDQPNTLLAPAFAEANLTLIDVLPSLRKKADERQLLFGKVDVHLNALGHRAVAECILSAVESELAKMGIHR